MKPYTPTSRSERAAAIADGRLPGLGWDPPPVAPTAANLARPQARNVHDDTTARVAKQ